MALIHSVVLETHESSRFYILYIIFSFFFLFYLRKMEKKKINIYFLKRKNVLFFTRQLII